MILLLLLSLTASLRAQSGYAEVERIYRDSAAPDRELGAILEAEPENPWVLDFLALVERDRGRWEEGLSLVQKAFRLDPNQAWHRKVQGELLMAAGRPAEAAQAFAAAVERETREEVRFALFQQQQGAELAAAQRRAQEEEMAGFAARLRILGILALVVTAAALVLALRR